MAYIGRDIEYGVLEKQTLTADSSTVAFDLTYVSDANGLIVSVGGIVQEPNVAYTVLGSTLTFTAAPTTGDTVYVVYLGEELTVSGVTPTDYMDYQVGTGDGSDTTPITTLSHSVSLAQDIMVTLNGIRQVPVTDYTVSGTTLTFTTAPADGVTILVYFLLLLRAEGTVLDNSVTDAKIIGMSGSKITTGTVPAGAASNASIIGMDAAKLTGTLPESMGADLSLSYQRLATLGLHVQNVKNKVAFNLTNSFLDSFEDSTGVDSTNSVNALVSSDEYVTSTSELDTATNIAPSSNDWDYSFASNHWTVAGNSLGDHSVGGYVDGQGNSGLSSLTTLDGDFVIKWTSDNDEGVTFGVASITDDGSRSQSDGIGMHSSGIESYYYREAGGNINKFWIGNSVESGNAYIFADGSEIVMRRASGTITIEDDGVVVHTFSTTNNNPVRFFISNNQTSKVDISDLTIEDTAKIQRDGFINEAGGDAGFNFGDAITNAKNVGTRFKATRTGSISTVKFVVGAHVANFDAVAKLYSDDGTSPASQIGSDSTALTLSSTGTKLLDCTGKGQNVVKGTSYWIILNDSTADGNGDVDIRQITGGIPFGGAGYKDVITDITDHATHDVGVEIIVDTSVGEPTPDHDTLLLIQSDTTNTIVSPSVDAGGTSGSWGAENTAENVGGIGSALTYGTGDDLGMNGNSFNYNFISHSSGTDSNTGEAILEGNCKSSFTGVSADVGATTTGGASEYYEFGLMTSISSAGTASITAITSDGIYIAFGGNGEDIHILKKSGTGETLLSTYTTSWTSSQEISLARSGSTMYLQIDGVNVYTVPSSDFNSSAPLKAIYAFGRGATARAYNNCSFRYNATYLKGIDTTNATFVDDSQYERGITVTGDAQHSTSRAKFGSTSMYFDGTQDHLKLPSSTDWNFGTDDFTIDYWVNGISGNDAAIIRFGNQAVPTTGQAAGFGYISSGGQLKLYLSSGSSWDIASSVNMGAYPTGNEWVHFAVVRKQNTWTTYRNGTQVSTFTDSSSLNTTGGGGNNLHIMDDWGTAGTMASGYVDGIRISKVARWDADFTPPTTPYLTATKSTVSATGTLASTSSTADSTVSEVTGVLLVKDGVGTNTIGTDLKAYFSSDDGSNWTEAASYGDTVRFTNTPDTVTEVYVTGDRGSDITVSGVGITAAAGDITNLVNGDNSSNSQFDWNVSTIAAGDSIKYVFSSAKTITEYKYYTHNTMASVAAPKMGDWKWQGSNDGSSWTDIGATFNFNQPSLSTTYTSMSDNTTSYTQYQMVCVTPPHNNGNPWHREIEFQEYNATSVGQTKVIPLGETTLTGGTGTAVKMKAEWANQAATIPASGTTKYITPIGEATHSSSLVKIGNSSMYFDGSGDYLQLADHANWDLGTNDFTIECYFHASSFANKGLIDMNKFSTNAAGVLTLSTSGGGQYIKFQTGSGTDVRSANTLSTNTWYHVAVVRSGTTITLYLDGVGTTAETSTSFNHSSSNGIAVGGYYSTGYLFNGYMDEVRISNSARYTADFTPSTTAFTNDANTKLLIHSNTTDNGVTFIDSSSNTHSITVAGGIKHSDSQSKIGNSSIYSTDTNGAGLTVDASDASWDSGTNSFTWEAWIRTVDKTKTQEIISFYGSGSGELGENTLMRIHGSSIKAKIGGQELVSGATISNNTWHHICFERTSTTQFYLYVDGVGTASSGFSSHSIATNSVTIANHKVDGGDNTENFDGYIDEVRISNVARYSGTNFTPSTTAFTSDSDTQLLIHSDDYSTTFTDSSSTGHTVTATGDAKHKPVVKKNGTSSMYFNGSGAGNGNTYLQVTDHADFDFGTDDFTIESWVYQTSSASGGANYHVIWHTSDVDSHGIGCIWHNDGTLEFHFGNGSWSNYRTTTTYSNNQWHHIAESRSGGTVKIFVNGVEVQSLTRNGTYDTNQSLKFGGWRPVANGAEILGNTFQGYMDEMRISDTARYTSAFTPSTTAFTTDANTQLLIHGDSSNPQTQVGQGDGNAIGTMTDAGGLSAAFDGTTSQSNGASAADSTTAEAWLGKDWGTDYSNNCGTGDRRSIITVTTDLNIQSGVVTSLVDGAIGTSNGWYPVASQSAAGKYIRFQLSYAKAFNDVTFRTAAADGGLGIWKFQGSNDGTTWTDLSGNVTLGNAITESFSLNNTTAYTYYQAVGVSGTPIDNWIYEFEFGEYTGVTKTISGFKAWSTNNDGMSDHGSNTCLLYTSPSPRDRTRSRMPSSA